MFTLWRELSHFLFVAATRVTKDNAHPTILAWLLSGTSCRFAQEWPPQAQEWSHKNTRLQPSDKSIGSIHSLLTARQLVSSSTRFSSVVGQVPYIRRMSLSISVDRSILTNTNLCCDILINNIRRNHTEYVNKFPVFSPDPSEGGL